MTDSLITVLLVDDNAANLEILQDNLADSGYALVSACDGVEALEKLTCEPHRYHAVLLDLMMPRMTGMEVLQHMKAHPVLMHVPVIIQTAAASPTDVTEGLAAGAHYYLTKPFAIDELLARVRALLRRGATESPGILQIDDLVLNPATREVTRGGQRIELTLKEYALLEYLMRHTGRVLTRPMISEHVWNQDFDTFTNVIDVYVNYLRNKIDRGRSKKLIHTIRGSGYMLKAD